MDINSLANENDESDTEDEQDDNDDESLKDNDDNGGERMENEGGSVAGSQFNLEDDELDQANALRSSRESQAVKFSMGFRDIEETIRELDGNDNFPVECWLADFEDAVLLFNWTDLERLVFAKRSLKGLAKLFIQSESGLITWKKLRTALIKEFSTKISSAKLHSMLLKRKIKETESIQEYFLIMWEIASRGSIETDALFDYVIDGLGDCFSNKAILYGTKTKDSVEDKMPGPSNIKTSRCFNCGVAGHLSKDCKNKDRGTKCFRCNDFGHIATKCKS